MTERPRVLFVCVHNAGRSQMAAAFLRHLGGGAVEVRSAGSAPAEEVNPVAVAAMAEVGIDIAAAQPARLTDDDVRASDVVVTMGCGDACPFYPGLRYEDWVLDDPAGQGLEAVRGIRDEIRRRVEALVAELVPSRRSVAAASRVGVPGLRTGLRPRLAVDQTWRAGSRRVRWGTGTGVDDPPGWY